MKMNEAIKLVVLKLSQDTQLYMYNRLALSLRPFLSSLLDIEHG